MIIVYASLGLLCGIAAVLIFLVVATGQPKWSRRKTIAVLAVLILTGLYFFARAWFLSTPWLSENG